MRELIKTYVKGFDEVIGGGIPEKHSVLIYGAPGTMKSTLSYSILYHNAVEEERFGMYVSLEQSRESLKKQMKGLGMDPEVVEGFVDILDLGMVRKRMSSLTKAAFLDVLKMYLERSRDLHHLVVIDSLPVIEHLCRWKEPRESLASFIRWIKEMGYTSLFISEMPREISERLSAVQEKGTVFGRWGEEFVADGIISLYMEEMPDTSLQRRIRCIKLRERPHGLDAYQFFWAEGAFHIRNIIGGPRVYGPSSAPSHPSLFG